MKKQVFCVKKNVQIFCSAGILRWRGDARRSRMEKLGWQTEVLKIFTVDWHLSCSSCRFAARLPAQVQLQPVLLAQSALKGTVDTRGSPGQGAFKTMTPENPSHTHASAHPHSSPIILCTPCSAGLATTAKVVSSCPWNDRGDAVEADLQDVAPPAIETPCDAEAGEVGGAIISPSRNSVQKLAETRRNSAALATIFL